MEYWHDMITEESWLLLQKIKGKFDFVLIGGWAVYLWARKNKSKDIDIIVDFNTLNSLKKNYDLGKNDKLRKYEIKENNIDIDIYVSGFSKLGLPLDKIETTRVEGFVVAKIEELLILKQFAENARHASEKGQKDRIDIMGLLLGCEINFPRYNKILLQNKLEHMKSELLSLVRNFSEYNYVGLDPRQFKLQKNKIVEKLRSV